MERLYEGMDTDYVDVTEVVGNDVSREQVQRMYARYSFARIYSEGKDVLELGCGSGQGLGFLASVARKVVGSDYSWPLLKIAKDHYRERVPLIRLDAQVLPVKAETFDVVILFEAIYYLKDSGSFVKECLRVLRPGGCLLICNPNKDLPDFNPSPHSYQYFAPQEFVGLVKPFGLRVECYADCEVNYASLKQKVFSVIKKVVVKFHLMPRTMAGKNVLKRIVFGKLVALPAELEDVAACQLPCRIDSSSSNLTHKVIFAFVQKKA